MTDVEQHLPGTWIVKVTLNKGFVGKAVITFTSDGGTVERFTADTEGNVGVWEATGKKDGFRLMAYRYIVEATTFKHNSRVRATCEFNDNDTFQCTATADQLDIDDKVIPGTTTAGFELNGSRLKVVSE